MTERVFTRFSSKPALKFRDIILSFIKALRTSAQANLVDLETNLGW